MDEVKEQKLDDYEQELEFMSEWVNIKEAIKNNENILANGNLNTTSWIRRETLALNNIYEIIKKEKCNS